MFKKVLMISIFIPFNLLASDEAGTPTIIRCASHRELGVEIRVEAVVMATLRRCVSNGDINQQHRLVMEVAQAVRQVYLEIPSDAAYSPQPSPSQLRLSPSQLRLMQEARNRE